MYRVVFPLLATVALLAGCGEKKCCNTSVAADTTSVAVADSNVTDSVKPDSLTAQVMKMAAPKGSLTATLRNALGDYPRNKEVLKDRVLQERLRKLLGAKRTDFLLTHWQTEVPVELRNGAFVLAGFEAHNATYNDFAIAYFPLTDNLMVKYIEKGEPEVFKDKEAAAPW